MTDKPLVSIITPCYNGESHLSYFLDSLLNQDYTNVEFIFVDDGSDDKTAEIFKSYIPKLESKGWSIRYIYQKHNCQAAAINQGLKIFKGTYLIWPDSDDILYSNHISEKVKFMEENPQYSLAWCITDIVNFEDKDKIINVDLNGQNTENAFLNLLDCNGTIWTYTVSSIARASAIRECIPKCNLTLSNGGQNIQITAPLLYKYPCGFIDKHLGKYVLRKNSHYHTTSKKFWQRKAYMFHIYISTIWKLPEAKLNEKISFSNRIIKRFVIEIFRTHFSIKNEYNNKSKHKVFTFFGIKIKFRVKNRN